MDPLSSSCPLPPKTPIRIAVLQADRALPQPISKYGGYTGLYTLLLHTGADSFGWSSPRDKLQISKWDIIQRGAELSEQEVEKIEYPQLEDIDAIIISGSKCPAREYLLCGGVTALMNGLCYIEFSALDTSPWINRLVAYTKSVLAQTRVRIIGVCFGHQIVGRALGSILTRSPLGFEVSICKVDLTEMGKSLLGGNESLQIMQMHRDIVVACPPGVKLLGSSPMCENQGMYVQRRLFTMQAHPEFKDDIMKELIEIRKREKILDETLAADGLRRVMERNDGYVVAKAFLRFLIE